MCAMSGGQRESLYEKYLDPGKGDLYTRCAVLCIYMFLLTLLGAAAIYYVDNEAQQKRITTKINNNTAEFLEIYCRLHSCFPKMMNSDFIESVRHIIMNRTQTEPKWMFTTAMFYCATVYTTIGYGHIAAISPAAKVLTMIYAIVSIPSFLLMLDASGKVLTRLIKHIYVIAWNAPGFLHVVMRTFRTATIRDDQKPLPTTFVQPMPRPLSTSPNSSITINEYLDLPIPLAITIWIVYIVCGGYLFNIWEEKFNLFQSIYFVFISLSTIGLGDVVPAHTRFTMMSFPYLIVGFALTAMCINVIKLRICARGECIVVEGVQDALKGVDVVSAGIQAKLCESFRKTEDTMAKSASSKKKEIL